MFYPLRSLSIAIILHRLLHSTQLLGYNPTGDLCPQQLFCLNDVIFAIRTTAPGIESHNDPIIGLKDHLPDVFQLTHLT